MARITRTRARTVSCGGGFSDLYILGNFGGRTSNTRDFSSSCADSHGRPVADTPFTSVQAKGQLPYVDGKIFPNFFISSTVTFSQFTLAPIPASMTSMSPIEAPSGWMLDLVAGTNPSRPTIGIPMWMQNVHEFPKMIRDAGHLLRDIGLIKNPQGILSFAKDTKRLSSTFLGVKFGWLPLIDDLTKLLDFQSLVIKRNRELAQLYSGKGLRRRLKFTDDSSNEAILLQYATYGNATVMFNCSLTITRKTWGTIHWKPAILPDYHPDDMERNRLARLLVIGLTPEGIAKGIWDVIPWTWLIGWFTNFGKYSLAYSLSVPATHGSGCFMSSVECKMSPSNVYAVNARVESLTCAGSLTTTMKTRSVSDSVTVGVNMPYLDMSRLSVLSALAIQRIAKSI